MKRLVVLRHAKSDWGTAGLADHDRPLAARGRAAADRIAAYLRREGVRPDLVLSSSALRTRETLERVRAGLPAVVAVRVEDALYGASAPELLARLHTLPDDAECVVLIGHNPGLEDLVLGLAGAGDEPLVARVEEKFPTGALATLHFDVAAWSEITAGSGRLTAYVVPRDLP